MTDRAQMRSNAFLPQGHIRDRRLGQEREESYRHRKNSQANSELQVETFSRAVDYRNRTINIRRPRRRSTLLWHETARPQLENSAPDPTPTSCPLSHRFRPPILASTPSRAPSSASVPPPANFNTSPSFHSICIRPTSAAPAASFCQLFRTRAPILCSTPLCSPGRASEKSLA